MAASNHFSEVNDAVLALNKALSKKGFRFVMFVEGFSDLDISEDSNEGVAPNKEVMGYPIEKLLLSAVTYDGDVIDTKLPVPEDVKPNIGAIVYSNQYNLMSSGSLIGSVMSSNEKVFDLVQYAFACGKMETAAITLLQHEADLMLGDEDEDEDFEDLEDH